MPTVIVTPATAIAPVAAMTTFVQMLQLLYLWEGDGFLLCYKRLEQKASKFQWPRSQEEVCK